MSIHVLRLGHRIFRDKRLSSHVFLTARAFGCDGGIYSGQKDSKLEKTIKKTVQNWGGPFTVEFTDNWKKTTSKYKKKKWVITHLTMYGVNLPKIISRIRKSKKNILLIVGSQKVEPEAFAVSDFNIAVGNTPHSEVSSLAIFLHEYFKGKELSKKFKNPRKRIVPQERGKKIIELK